MTVVAVFVLPALLMIAFVIVSILLQGRRLDRKLEARREGSKGK